MNPILTDEHAKGLRGLADLLRRCAPGIPDADFRNKLANAYEEAANRIQYLEDTLTAATTGALPEKFDLNQLLLSQRTEAYIRWLETTKDPRDTLRPATGDAA